MELKDTVSMMTSPDYKERFKAEYWQVKIRCQKLLKIMEGHLDGALSFTPACSTELLHNQLFTMKIYIDILEERALIEGIELEE